MDYKKLVKVADSKIKDSKYMAYSIILNGNDARELGNGDADYYFFCPSKKAVKDSADITKSVEFCIDEDNVYDLIHKGETSVAIPSGADTKAFVAAVEDILKEVASDCGVKGLKIETEIVGNRVNVIKK